MTPESLAEGLRITPYSLDLGDDTRPHLEGLISKALELENRYRAIRDHVSVLLRTDPEFRAFQTYHSNKLELQGPELAETKLIIEEYSRHDEPDDLRTFAAIQAINQIDSVTSENHLIEVLGQHQANILVERIATSFPEQDFLRPHDIRQLNKFCIQHKFYAGEFRETDRVNIDQFFEDDDELWFSRDLNHPVEVTWTDIPDEIRKICDYMSKKQECPILAASVAHAWFTRVHPFHDGNGRTARLIANLVLVRNDWPPLTITKQNRDEYIDALRESDSGGDIRLLFDLFVRCMDRGLSEIEDPKFWRRRYRIEARKSEDQRYTTWVQLVREFVNNLRTYGSSTGWSFERVTIPDKTTYELLEAGDPTASVTVGWLKHPDRREIKVHVGFMSNRLRQADKIDVTIDGDHFPPTFYLRERNFLSNSDHPFVHRKESELPIREFTFVPGFEEKRQSKVLYGATSPTPIEMSIDLLCRQLAYEIDELQFPGLERVSRFDNDTEDFLELLNPLIMARTLPSWENVYVAILEQIRQGNIFGNEILGPGILMSKLGLLASRISSRFPQLGERNRNLGESLFQLLNSADFGLTLVNSSHTPPHPILVRNESIRNRQLWTPSFSSSRDQ
jgi:Fic family protein